MAKITYKEIDPPPTVPHGRAWISNTNCSIFVSMDADRWHLSIAHPGRYPTWSEIHHARYEFIPDEIYMCMILPPKQFYINLHKNCFHLWEFQELKLKWITEQV